MVELGIYGGVQKGDRRIAAIETTDKVIDAVMWTAFPLADAKFEAPDGIPVQRDVLIENAVICTFVRDTNGYCEFTYTGSGLRLAMLCNVQDEGRTCHNVPALKMYLDGEEYTTISMTDFSKYFWKAAPDIVFEDLTIPYGTHTVKFVNTTEGEFDSAAAYYCGILLHKVILFPGFLPLRDERTSGRNGEKERKKRDTKNRDNNRCPGGIYGTCPLRLFAYRRGTTGPEASRQAGQEKKPCGMTRQNLF